MEDWIVRPSGYRACRMTLPRIPALFPCRPTRRPLLRIGLSGLLGSRFAAFASAESRRCKARSVIFLHQYGGPSHHDTFDMKPAAPAEVRGEFKPISTSVPGVQI